MKTFVALFALFAVALAAPAGHVVPATPVGHVVSATPASHVVSATPVALQHYARVVTPRPYIDYTPSSDIVVLKETLHNNNGLGGYQYSYELSDGTARDESAQIETRGAEDATVRVTGSFRFVALDGQTYTVTYVADENGFQPQGAHLPVSSQLH